MNGNRRVRKVMFTVLFNSEGVIYGESSCDYHLFCSFNQDQGGEHFTTDHEVQEAVSK